ncbi:MAG: NADH-quinone oxidoreductase subunit L, partial [Thermoanaerobaculum sp.]
AFLTAFYMFRAVHMTFSGEFRGSGEQAHHLHEAPPSMAWPLRILGVGSVVVGFVGVGRALSFGADINVFEHFLHEVAPVVEVGHVSLALEWGLILLSVGVAALGIDLATRFYTGEQAFAVPKSFAQRFPRLYQLVANKYYVDELYAATVVKPLEKTSYFAWKGLDTVAIDGTLNALAFFTELAGDFLRFLQTGNVRNYALWVLAGAAALAAWLAL